MKNFLVILLDHESPAYWISSPYGRPHPSGSPFFYFAHHLVTGEPLAIPSMGCPMPRIPRRPNQNNLFLGTGKAGFQDDQGALWAVMVKAGGGRFYSHPPLTIFPSWKHAPDVNLVHSGTLANGSPWGIIRHLPLEDHDTFMAHLPSNGNS